MKTDFGQGKGRATLLLTHAHWDHIQGFPFFAPIFIPGNQFTVYGPSESPAMVEGILEGQMDPHFSPVHSLRNLGADFAVKSTQEGIAMRVDDLEVIGRFNPHGGYTALAYSLQEGKTKVVYAPDVGYLQETPPDEILQLYRNASLLIHDCTYTPEDQEVRRSRGQSSIADAARVAALSRVKSLVMFHYDQDYTDDRVDQLKDRCRLLLDQQPEGKQIDLVAAAEGLSIDV
jgi:phosphoribosyl 1,2-cyclic phosphodiesterase